MCGLIGIIAKQPDVVRNGLTEGRLSMVKRGPDAGGEWWSPDGRVGLGHQRLAIIDLDSRSNQPLVSSSGRYIIVFNGEIYNYQDLRSELLKRGYCFRTNSDTEVLVELFAEFGDRMLSMVRGMFAVGIWDTVTKEMFLARDPYGIKPLYYSATSAGFVFASQVKAIKATGFQPGGVELAGLAGFYLWGSVPEPWTIYQDILSLPAGHWLRVGLEHARPPVCWYDIRTHWLEKSIKCSVAELEETVRHAVKDSLAAHLVADVPIGVFLSGGIDSGVIAGLTAELGMPVQGITIGFEEFEGCQSDEVPFATAIMEHCGFSHYVRRVSRSEFLQDLPRVVEAMDQPSIDGVNTWLVSKAAAERGLKVVLSGVGGDELFCGYSSFRNVPLAAKLGKALKLLPRGRRLLKAPCDWFARQYDAPKIAGLPMFAKSNEGLYFLQRCLFLPHELSGLMGFEQAQEGLKRLAGDPPGMAPELARSDLSAVGLMESTYYLRNQLLRDSDWASMAHSLELRTPLVDVKLLATLGPFVDHFAGGVGKKLLSRVAKRALPQAVINRPKVGFSLPMAEWLAKTTSQEKQAEIQLPAPSNEPWARQWARTVVETMIGRT
jgi:asparagine synthase (glutamine-hydrolysing)